MEDTMHRHLQAALGTLALIGLLAGCGKSNKSLVSSGSNGSGISSAAASVARAQANDQVAANLQLVDEDAFMNATPMGMSFDPAGGAALIHPLRWYRKIDSVDRTITTDVSDPDSLGRPQTALVTVNKVLKGTLNILASDSLGADTTRIAKPLEDHWTRKLLLKRVWIDSSGAVAKWRIVGTSGVNVVSAPSTTQILSVRIQTATKDTTITDPLLLHLRRRMLHVPAGDSVMVTVTTTKTDDDVVFYRGFDRRRFHSNGDGTYSIVFRTGDFEGLQHFGVNALSRGTLHDDAAAYSSNAWVFPFAARDHDCDVESEDHHR
jgi:hypothetical protein